MIGHEACCWQGVEYRRTKIQWWVWVLWQPSGLCCMLFIHCMASNPLLPVIPPVSSICPVILPYHLTNTIKWKTFRDFGESLNLISTRECKHFFDNKEGWKKKTLMQNNILHERQFLSGLARPPCPSSQNCSDWLSGNWVFYRPLTFHQEKNHTSAAEMRPSPGSIYSWQVGWLQLLSSV